MAKLCVVITTVYSQAVKNRDVVLWTREVAEDQVTIAETLTDYDIKILEIPTSLKNISVALRRQIEKTLDIDPTAPWELCHIVLNTHGAAGSSDSSNDVVSEIVMQLSSSRIPVTQISALQCSGLSGLTALQVRARDQMRPAHKRAGAQEPSLERLRNRLKKTKTAIPQSFHIYGFSKSYTPTENKDDVKALLQGKWDEYLEVNTPTERPLTPQKIRACMSQCLEEKKRGTNTKEYQEASDILGKVIHNMETNITLRLRQEKSLSEEDKILYDAIFPEHKRIPDALLVTPDVFVPEYKAWIKTNKLVSEARMRVIEAYCQALESKADATKISGSKNGFFPIHRDRPSSPTVSGPTPQIDLDSEPVASPIPEDDTANKP